MDKAWTMNIGGIYKILNRRMVPAFLMMVMLSACGNNNQVRDLDTAKKGTIYISVDESFKPIIDSQIQVYESSNPEAKIIAHYKPEAECFKDLLIDSIRMIIVTRGPSRAEERFYEDTFRFKPSWDRIAYDALTMIVNNEAKDSIFTMEEIKDMLTGASDADNEIVFDGLSATSNVRFAMDSILKGEKLTDKVRAAASSQEVIDYVSKVPNAIGFIGVSWIGNKQDPSQLSFLETVKIASIKSRLDDGYVKPYQANIAKRRYPMVRSLYYIVKENYSGLGKGFANFMTFQRGQLIFKRAYLWPAKMNFTIRDAKISE